jgi:para-aminobenzoate synthetase component 1
LDSALPGGPLGRYSFLAADPVALVRSTGALTQVRAPAGGGTWSRFAGDPLAAAQEFLAPFRTEPLDGLPPFQGGAAGYLGYDWGETLERLPRARYDDRHAPDVVLGIYDWVIAWDHASARAWIVSTGIPQQGAARAPRAAERLALVRERLKDRRTARPPDRRAGPPLRPSAPSYPVPDFPGVRSNFTRAGYLEAVSRVVEYIRAGDIFQANLSQRLEASYAGAPFELYQRLRARNPAPFAAFLDFDDVVIASASPERFVRVGDGLVEARPIKGTRPRGMGPEHDAALALALVESDKDRAENVMIVDLLRNDLSRVCRPGTVHAPELFAIEHYATVHHLVSTVVGDLAPNLDAGDLLRAAFPGGSITGAPKVRAMQVIAELEPTRRGAYCGAIGYWSVTGALDASIVIRTFVLNGATAYFQAGGGIVADSDPEEEYRETLDKARGLVAALAP